MALHDGKGLACKNSGCSCHAQESTKEEGSRFGGSGRGHWTRRRGQGWRWRKSKSFWLLFSYRPTFFSCCQLPASNSPPWTSCPLTSCHVSVDGSRLPGAKGRSQTRNSRGVRSGGEAMRIAVVLLTPQLCGPHVHTQPRDSQRYCKTVQLTKPRSSLKGKPEFRESCLGPVWGWSCMESAHLRLIWNERLFWKEHKTRKHETDWDTAKPFDLNLMP